MPKLLQALVKCHKDNKDKKLNAWRYKDDLIKNFSTLSRDLGGKQSYEFWSKNLPMPSLSTVAAYSKKSSNPIVEGEFRFPELVRYLDDRNLGREVWLSEDGTRIKVQVQYDPRTNQLVGLTPKLDINGLPKVGSFPADSAQSIKDKLLSEKVSNYVYVLMAQPMADISPFLLCFFGTDNSFTTEQVLLRWKWLCQEATKHGVTILGFSSDGDPKMLSAMKQWTFGKSLQVLPEWENVFFSPMDLLSTENLYDCEFFESLSPLCIQDTVHTVAKLKTQLLKHRSDNNFLPMGQFVASGTFLTILVEDQSKLNHGLCMSDLDSNDKMNFRSVEKISDSRVIDALDSIPGSKGTKIYLVMLRGVLDSFLDKGLPASRRIYLIWRTVFFLRHWRNWLKENSYKVTPNFLTANTYQCVEVSAHSLVNIYRRCRDAGKLHLFIPWLMSSQPCEAYFRSARSLTSMLHTAVNMTILEFQQKATKIERMLQTNHELNKEIVVPRHHKKMKDAEVLADTLRNQEVFTDTQLLKAISAAEKDSLSLAQELGMQCSSNKHQFPTFMTNIRVEDPLLAEDSGEEELSEDNSDFPTDMNILPQDVAEDLIMIDQNLNNVPDDICLPRSSPFVITEEEGKQVIIKKTTLIWSLTSRKHTLSSNRLERVKAAEEILRHTAGENNNSVLIAENINLGDWVVFNGCPLPNRLYVGRILNFTYLSGSGKARECSSSSVPTTAPVQDARGIGCLGDWYTLSCEGIGNLVKFHEPAAYLNINNYICSLPRPTSVNGTLSYCNGILISILSTLPSNARGKSLSNNSSKDVQVSRPKETKRKSRGRLIFPDSDDDMSPSTSSATQQNTASPLRMSPRRSQVTSQKTKYQKRMAPRKSVSPMPTSPSRNKSVTPSFTPLERPPEKGEFVLVEFEGKSAPRYYVAQVLSDIDEDNDIDVTYLRKTVESSEKLNFAFPHVADEACVHLDWVKMILQKPLCSGSKRHNRLFQFGESFSGLNIC